jgi:hypothetical protein
MKFFSFVMIVVFISCASQNNSEKNKIEFEDIYHHYFNLTAEKSFFRINSQEKMKEVYAKIYKHYGGKRSAPIPFLNEDFTYLIIKPVLKNSNDVEIVNVESTGQTLHITVKPFQNPEVEKEGRFSPNILLKLSQKVSFNQVLINNQK